jgi:hypothetical protein
MSSKSSPAAAQFPSRSFQEPNLPAPVNCLLCRLLWPTVVGHRHVTLDDSSEAKTLCITRVGPANDHRAC